MDKGNVYDWLKEMKEFDETKAGVKGLMDAGMVKIPKFFIHPKENLDRASSEGRDTQLSIPLIDLQGFDGARRAYITTQIHDASEKWGFFQIINHGIPNNVLSAMLDGVQHFHEQPNKVKMEIYSRDFTKKVRYYCNGNLYLTKVADWRDSLCCHFADGRLETEALPLVCREAILEYMKWIIKLKEVLAELLSEALGLESNYLANIQCMETETLLCHYYPSCPEPNLTMGTNRHCDPSFLTILLQDNIGGLQVLHQNQWVNVPPLEGALIINLGDLMQLITNDMFKSVEHRVLAQVGDRVSAACFFYPSTREAQRPYGPLKELLSDKNPTVIYKETLASEYLAHHRYNGLDGSPALPHFKL